MSDREMFLLVIPFHSDFVFRGPPIYLHEMYFRDFLREFDVGIYELDVGEKGEEFLTNIFLASKPFVFLFSPKERAAKLYEWSELEEAVNVGILVVPISCDQSYLWSVGDVLDTSIKWAIDGWIMDSRDEGAKKILESVRRELDRYLAEEESFYYLRDVIGIDVKEDERTFFFEVYCFPEKKVSGYVKKEIKIRPLAVIASSICTAIFFNIFQRLLWLIIDSISVTLSRVSEISSGDIEYLLPIMNSMLKTLRFILAPTHVFRLRACEKLYIFMAYNMGVISEARIISDMLSGYYNIVTSVTQTRILESSDETTREMYSLHQMQEILGSRMEFLNLLITALVGLEIGSLLYDYVRGYGVGLAFFAIVCTILMFVVLSYVQSWIRGTAYPKIRIEVDLAEYQKSPITKYDLDVAIDNIRSRSDIIDLIMVDREPKGARIEMNPKGLEDIKISVRYYLDKQTNKYMPAVLRIESVPMLSIRTFLIALTMLIPTIIMAYIIYHYYAAGSMLGVVLGILTCFSIFLIGGNIVREMRKRTPRRLEEIMGDILSAIIPKEKAYEIWRTKIRNLLLE